MRQSRVRQEDIARAVGVSVSTVSRVLSGAPGISPATAEKVMRAAADLGTPVTGPTGGPGSAVAAHKMQRALLFLNQVDINTGSGSIYHFVITGIQKAAKKAGLPIELALLGDDGEIPEKILGGPETGVLFAGVDPCHNVSERLKNKGHPTVIVNGLDPTMRHDQVAPNNYFGGQLAAQYLVSMGHRRILHLGTRRRWTLSARTDGFRAGIDGADVTGLKCDNIELPNVTEHDARVTLNDLLERGDFAYSAVFCAADNVALTAMQELRMRGIEVPRQVSLLGFNGLPVAELSSPLLSTLAVDWEFLGAESIRILALRSLEPLRPTQQIQTQVVLHRGESVIEAN
ncbi:MULTISPECIES: LacI family DNA-binding transcriptional regulator [Marinovum]|uniref:LacI family DNA-binding transcriptional regulator n=1 Tax=Marinovum TaxID=367771 RepID=UPI00237AF411|nr:MULTISPECIES: LacI family DNA-binding transcriptional regulator [Marinovum]MDD9739400.1 LacI family DNA-binding transcriptional regulator [Marinovum sp. SP66]